MKYLYVGSISRLSYHLDSDLNLALFFWIRQHLHTNFHPVKFRKSTYLIISLVTSCGSDVCFAP